MGTEQLVGGLVMLAIGIGAGAVGWLGRMRRIDFAMGGHTRETSTPESWDRAHRTIGGWLMLAGAVAIVTAVVALIVDDSAVGPVVVAGSIALLVPTVFGVARGLGQIEPAQP